MCKLTSPWHQFDFTVIEEDYLAPTGEFRVDALAPRALRAALAYRMCYHRFHTRLTEHGQPRGYDRVRRQVVPPLRADENDDEEADEQTDMWSTSAGPTHKGAKTADAATGADGGDNVLHGVREVYTSTNWLVRVYRVLDAPVLYGN